MLHLKTNSVLVVLAFHCDATSSKRWYDPSFESASDDGCRTGCGLVSSMNLYGYQENYTCVKACSPELYEVVNQGAGLPTVNVCRSKCDFNVSYEMYMGDSGVAQCLKDSEDCSQPLYYLEQMQYPSKGICLYPCTISPYTFVDQNTRLCSSKCALGLYIWNDNVRRCVAQCQGEKAKYSDGNGQLVCQNSCPAEQSLEVVDLAFAVPEGQQKPMKCVASCNWEEKQIQYEARCVYSCPEGTNIVIMQWGGYICEPNATFLAIKPIGLVKTNCTNGLYYVDGQNLNICVTYCPQGYIQHPVDRRCVQTCPQNMVLSGAECLSNCPALTFNNSGVCVPHCTANTFYYNGRCVSECPGDTFSDSTARKCITQQKALSTTATALLVVSIILVCALGVLLVLQNVSLKKTIKHSLEVKARIEERKLNQLNYF